MSFRPVFLGLVLIATGLAGCGSPDRPDPVKTAFAIATLPITLPIVARKNWESAHPLPTLRPYPGDDVPLFRGVGKTPDILQADADFIAAVGKQGYSRHEGSRIAAQRGWQALNTPDYTLAAKSFNEAWLLDPKNGDAVYGFGMVAAYRDKNSALAEDYFRQSIAIMGEWGCARVEYGKLLLNENRVAEAIPLLRAAADGRCKQADARSLLVIALDTTGDKASVCRESLDLKDWSDKTLLAEARRRASGCPKLQ